MTMLLAGCGSGGSTAGSAAGLSTGTSTAQDTSSTSTPPDSPTSDASASSTTTKTSAPQGNSSSRSTGAQSTTRSGSAKPPAAATKSGTAGDKPVALCTVKQLRISVGGGNADMQGTHRSLRFTNAGNSVCKLTGAPGVSYVAGSDGHQVGLPAKRIVGHQPIVLIPNATASAGLFISSAPHKSACAKTSVRGIRVYPPDSYQAAFVPMTEITCAANDSGPYLTVGPILPGPNNTV